MTTTTKWNTDKSDVSKDSSKVEGFESPFIFFDNDYYKGCNNFGSIPGLNLQDGLGHIFDYLVSPFSTFDHYLSIGINYTLRNYWIATDCMTKSETFALMNALHNEESGSGSGSDSIIEGLSMSEDGSHIAKLLQPIISRHSWINTPQIKNAVVMFYITAANTEENKIGRYMNYNEINVFNQKFDLSLYETNTKTNILNVATSTYSYNENIEINKDVNKLSDEVKKLSNVSLSGVNAIGAKYEKCLKESHLKDGQFDSDTSWIKRELYSIFSIPVMLFVIYNLFFIFYYKNLNGNTELYKIDWLYIWTPFTAMFTSGMQENLAFLFDISFFPIVFITGWFKKLLIELAYTPTGFDYMVFFTLLFIVYSSFTAISSYDSSVIQNIKGFLTYNSNGEKSRLYQSILSNLIFVLILFKVFDVFSDKNMSENFTSVIWKVPPFGVIYYILYWIFRISVSMFFIPISQFIITVYFMSYLFFSMKIYGLKQNVKETIDGINESIYRSIYGISDPRCNPSPIYQVIHMLFKYGFTFLIEILIILILLSYITLFNTNNNIKNVDVQVFLSVFNAVVIAGVIAWMWYKRKKVADLDARYII
jgi:hypothetical protein